MLYISDEEGDVTPNVPINKVETLLHGLYLTVSDMMFLKKYLPYVDDTKAERQHKERILSDYLQSKLN